MKPRVRMAIVADGEEAPVDETATPAETGGNRWHAVALVESKWTSDGRWFENIGVREEALARGALPLMADDRTHMEHQESVLIGTADRFEKQGAALHLWGSYLDQPDERAAYLINLVKTGKLPGFSADVEATEFEVLFPVASEEEVAAMEEDVAPDAASDTRETDDDGQQFEVVPASKMNPKLRITEGQLMGGTALPFPAFEDTWVEHDGDVALVASALMSKRGAPFGFFMFDDAVTAAAVSRVADRADGPREAAPARFAFPDIPPRDWFYVPETPGPMPLTILDSGQVFGHLALWGECHVGIAGECVEPPQSACSYARFHVGEVPVAPDGRVAVGRLTFGGPHADTRLDPQATLRHYDTSTLCAADVRASDGEYGIWLCGAARSTLSTAQIREVMACPPSGDWRRWGADLELVGALCVNVPGFNTPREYVTASGALVQEPVTAARVRKTDGLVSSLIVTHPAKALDQRTASHYFGPGFHDEAAARVIERMARTLGKAPEQRIAQIAARLGRSV